MSNMIQRQQDAFLDWAFNGVSFGKPNLFLALGNGEPTKDGSTTNETMGGMARQAITFADASGGANATTANTSQNDFDTSGTTWSGQSLDHFLIFDAASGGNLWHYVPMDSTITVDAGQPIEVDPGAVNVNFFDGATTSAHFSDWVRESWLTHFFGVTDLNTQRPTNWQMGLHTADPSSTGNANELTGGGYSRQSMNFGTVANYTPSPPFRAVSNDSDLIWSTPSATITWWSIHSTSPGAQFLARSSQASETLSGSARANAGTIFCAVN